MEKDMVPNSNTIELIVHTSCYCILDLLCVNRYVRSGWWKVVCDAGGGWRVVHIIPNTP